VQRKNSVENGPARDIETSKRFQAAYERARSLSKSREERPASRGNSEERFKAVYERARSMSKSRGERRDSGKSVTSSSNFEERLQRKLSNEDRRMDSFERRLARKKSEGSSRSIASNNSVSSFEERLQKKLSSDGKSSEDKFQEVFERARSLKKSKENGSDDDDSVGIV
jgi:ribonuclease D